MKNPYLKFLFGKRGPLQPPPFSQPDHYGEDEDEPRYKNEDYQKEEMRGGCLIVLAVFGLLILLCLILRLINKGG